jgi:sulfotransferase family protein
MCKRSLDFIVIGAQKAGTTSLWQYLRGHPLIALPDDKEAPFFFTPAASEPGGFASFVDLHFKDAPADAVVGKITPHYMMGNQRVSAEMIAQRIAHVLPDVRIIALLRDPIERAISHYRMSIRRGVEERSFEQVAQDLCVAAQLISAREDPTETNSYLSQGEYGRILTSYRRYIPSSQLHIEFTTELESRPSGVINRILEFIGLEPSHSPADLGVRHHRGGLRRRIDNDAERELRLFLGEHVWNRLGTDSDRIQRAFSFFFETWNILPDDDMPVISPHALTRLETHYKRDAEILASLGIEAPWLDTWRQRHGPTR